MNYPSAFRDLLDAYPDQYIGTGDPRAKVLIIGKECAIDPKRYPYQYRREILWNPCDWRRNVSQHISPETIPDHARDHALYNPLYPYKGQLFKIRSELRNEKIRGKGGTSATWYNYQKLIDTIRPESRPGKIDLHEFCFLTEFNHRTASWSKDLPRHRVAGAVRDRIPLFKHPFFQGFPIVIVACGHYPREFGIDLEALFSVRWVAPEEGTGPTLRIGSKWLNIHEQAQEERPKLLIHTNQLSVNVPNELLRQIGLLCRTFLSRHGLSIP